MLTEDSNHTKKEEDQQQQGQHHPRQISHEMNKNNSTSLNTKSSNDSIPQQTLRTSSAGNRITNDEKQVVHEHIFYNENQKHKKESDSFFKLGNDAESTTRFLVDGCHSAGSIHIDSCDQWHLMIACLNGNMEYIQTLVTFQDRYLQQLLFVPIDPNIQKYAYDYLKSHSEIGSLLSQNPSRFFGEDYKKIDYVHYLCFSTCWLFSKESLHSHPNHPNSGRKLCQPHENNPDSQDGTHSSTQFPQNTSTFIETTFSPSSNQSQEPTIFQSNNKLTDFNSDVKFSTIQHPHDNMVKTIEKLIDYSAIRVLNTTFNNGNSFLHFASQLNSIPLIQALLSRGVDASKANTEGMLPIDMTSCKQISKMLLMSSPSKNQSEKSQRCSSHKRNANWITSPESNNNTTTAPIICKENKNGESGNCQSIEDQTFQTEGDETLKNQAEEESIIANKVIKMDLGQEFRRI